jgi:hypothetical protein
VRVTWENLGRPAGDDFPCLGDAGFRVPLSSNPAANLPNGSGWREPALTLPDSGGRMRDIASVMLMVNTTLERWVTGVQGPWLCLHRRWPKTHAVALWLPE